MNSRIKTLLAEAARRSGFVSFLRRNAPTNVVFALHRVLPDRGATRGYDRNLSLRVSSFERFLDFLSPDFEIVSLADFVSRWKSETGKGLATITFDDGWIDNYQYAFPLLTQRRIPATIFLPTSLIGTNQRLPEERIVDLWECANARGAIHEFTEKLQRIVPSQGQNLETLRTSFKNIPLDARLEFLEQQEKQLGLTYPTRSFVTWDEVREMQRGGISFGSHTSRHASLPRENDEVVKNELENSRQQILRETGNLPEFFAYPNGLYDERVARLCEQIGFKAAFTTRNTFVPPSQSAFTIPRVAIDDTVIEDPAENFSPARADLYLARAARASN